MRTIRVCVCLFSIFLFLVGCNSAPVSNPTPGSDSGVPVSLSMTDDPPSGVTVLFFQISLTSASLTPASQGASVSLLPNNTPIQVDVTQLQALSAFLSTANVPAGAYNSLSLGFANPQLVIFNASNPSIAGTCPLHTVCQLTPQVDDSSTLAFSSAPFPVTVSANSPVGFLVDFHLNNIIQSDLSLNLGVSNGVTIDQLPATPVGPPQFGFLTGTVQNVDSSQNQFTIQTAFGRTLSVDVTSTTTYANFPSSVCSASAFSCLATGQVVQVQVAGLQTGGSLVAESVSYIQAASQQVVEGNIIGLSSSSGSTVMSLLLHWSPNAGSLPLGGVASVTVPSTATFSVDSGSFTIPSGLSFTAASDLLVGQAVQVEVEQGSVSSSGKKWAWSPSSVSFTAQSVELEPSQITGTVSSIDSKASSFVFTALPNFFASAANPNSTPASITVDTTSQTTFEGLSSDSLSGLAVDSTASVRGWLFASPSGSATPLTLVAETVLGRPNGSF